MDGHEFLQEELMKEGSTKGTEMWRNREFYTHVKAGVGTKKWSILYIN